MRHETLISNGAPDGERLIVGDLLSETGNFVDDENQRMEPGAPSRVLVALRVDATPERAFAAYTGEIGRWWRPNGLFQFSVRRTGELAFEPGPSGRLVEVATGARP